MKQEFKEKVWKFFVADTPIKEWPQHITIRRLTKIKDIVWKNNWFWYNSYERYNGLGLDPDVFKLNYKTNYENAKLNFWAMIVEKYYEHKTGTKTAKR